MYDVAPTLAFVRQRHFGMPVAGRFVITEITREHLVREASSWGMPERLARQTVERTLSAMRGAVSAADAAHPGLRADVRAASLEQLERVSRS